MAQILVVDDEEGLREFMADTLELDGHTVAQACDGEDAIRQLKAQGFDLVVSDLKMPNMDGMGLLKWLREEQPDVELILLTAFGSVETAVEAMKLGAFEFLQKPIGSPGGLRMVCKRALERRQLRAYKDHAARDRGEEDELTLTWGAPAMEPVVSSLKKVAATNATVLIVGESGTGKEVAAQAVHRWSPRASGPFVAINCAALNDQLLESELFGHEKGAFTGAQALRQGRIELAQGGTFFLDEVGELKAELQAKLLRVLQEKQFERVGGTRTMTADVRWIAATNRDLGASMAAGEFREDLYHRLAVFPVTLPALRDRREDLGPLAQSLTKTVCAEIGKPGLTLADDALARIESAGWPGNVRELRNALERAAIVTEGDKITAGDIWLDSAVARAQTSSTVERASGDAGLDGTLAELEQAAITRALDLTDGNRKQAAERLGIGVRTLYDKLKRYGIGQ